MGRHRMSKRPRWYLYDRASTSGPTTASVQSKLRNTSSLPPSPASLSQSEEVRIVSFVVSHPLEPSGGPSPRHFHGGRQETNSQCRNFFSCIWARHCLRSQSHNISRGFVFQ